MYNEILIFLLLQANVSCLKYILELISKSKIDYGRTQNWKIVRSFCAKVLLRIISILLIVLWQVLKPPIRKAIFKRILRQRFYSFNPTQRL